MCIFLAYYLIIVIKFITMTIKTKNNVIISNNIFDIKVEVIINDK